MRNIKKRIKLAYFWGTKYKCPFCGYSSRLLKESGQEIPILKTKQVVGGGKRRSVCYKCESSDRERLIYIYLENTLKIFNTKERINILHIAPEKNLSNKIAQYSHFNYICGDKSPEEYFPTLNVQNIDILHIPYSDNYYDIIICNHVLEHIPEDVKAIKELYRVLKPGGTAILQAPISINSENTYEDFSIIAPKAREAAFGQFDHVRIYGKDYQSRLEKGGFVINQINVSDKIEYKKMGLNEKEFIFIGKK